MQTAGKQKQKRNNSSRIRSGAAALCAALLLLLSGCGTAPDAQTIKQQEALTEGTLQDGQMSELQISEQQENGGSSTDEMAEPGEGQTPDHDGAFRERCGLRGNTGIVHGTCTG